MENKFYIKKFIRDDEETLELDGKEILLAQENSPLTMPDPETTAVEYTEIDGGEMIAQRMQVYEQEILGLLVSKKTNYWTLRQKLTNFFRINHKYEIIYQRRGGRLFAVKEAWISTGLQVQPQPLENYSEWSITMTVGNPNLIEYAEDTSGQETYAQNVELQLIGSGNGGEKWDKTGLIYDEIGEVWDSGSGDLKAIQINSSSIIYPVWTVEGPCHRPKLQNNTTDTQAEYDGNVAEGQTLIVDFATGVAHLDTALVTRNVIGLVSFNPGENIVGFSSEGGEAKSSLISWNNIIS